MKNEFKENYDKIIEEYNDYDPYVDFENEKKFLRRIINELMNLIETQ